MLFHGLGIEMYNLRVSSWLKGKGVMGHVVGFGLRVYLAALSRVASNLSFSCLIQKPNKPKKAKDLKLQ